MIKYFQYISEFVLMKFLNLNLLCKSPYFYILFVQLAYTHKKYYCYNNGIVKFTTKFIFYENFVIT